MTDAAAVIAGALRHQRDADPDVAAKAVVAALKGHGYQLDKPKRTPKTAAPIRRCEAPDDPHSGTALDGGRCPICGWRPNT